MSLVRTVFRKNYDFKIIIKIVSGKRIVSVEVNDFPSCVAGLQREFCVLSTKLAAKVGNVF